MMSFAEGPVTMHGDLDRVVFAVVAMVMLFAVALAGVGIYGVAAFLVSQRTREIGIKMALGATPREVVRNILAQGLRPVSAGVALGLAGSVAFGAVNRAQVPFPDTVLHSLFGDPAVYAAVVLLVGVALLASMIPARRAARVDPVVALRCD